MRKQPEQGGIRMFAGLREREARSNPWVSFGESKFESSPNRAEFECLQDCGSARRGAIRGYRSASRSSKAARTGRNSNVCRIAGAQGTKHPQVSHGRSRITFIIKKSAGKKNSMAGKTDMSKMVQSKIEKKTRTCYKAVGSSQIAGRFSCGYMYKPDESGSNINQVFHYYGGLLLLDGEGEYRDEDGRRIPLSKGCFVQRIPGKCHSTIVTPGKGWLEFFICVSARTYENLADIGLMSKEPVLSCGQMDDLLPELEDFLYKMERAGENELPGLYFQAQELLCRITSGCVREGSEEGIMEKACRRLRESQGRISGQELAEELDLSYETFRKHFRSFTGLSPGQYGIRTRMNEAMRLLTGSGLSLAEISELLGYPDYFTFGKQFKKETGMTPDAFRKMK